MTAYTQLNTDRTQILTTYESEPNGGYTYPNGISTGSVELITAEERIANGLVPITEIQPIYDDTYQTLVIQSSVIDEGGNSVTRTWIAQDKDLYTLKANKCSDIQSLRRDKLNACVAIGENPFSSDAIFLKSKEKCDDVMALTTAQAVVSYDIAAGW